MPIEHPTRLHSPTLVACHLARRARLLARITIAQWLSHTRHTVTPGRNLQSAISHRNVIGAICQMFLAIIIFILLKNLPIRQWRRKLLVIYHLPLLRLGNPTKHHRQSTRNKDTHYSIHQPTSSLHHYLLSLHTCVLIYSYVMYKCTRSVGFFNCYSMSGILQNKIRCCIARQTTSTPSHLYHSIAPLAAC